MPRSKHSPFRLYKPSVNAGEGKSRSLFCDTYEAHKYVQSVGRTLKFFLILNVVVHIITAGLVKLKGRHGKTTYSVKEPGSVWPYQNPDFDTAT